MLIGAIGPHDPDIHIAVDLATESNPLTIWRYRDFGFVHFVVRQALDIAAVEIG